MERHHPKGLNNTSRPASHAARRRFARTLSIAAVSAGLIVGGAASPAYANGSYSQGCFVITPTTGITTQTVYAYNTCSYTTGFQIYTMWPTPLGSGTLGGPLRPGRPATTGGWKRTKGRKFGRTGLC